MHSVPHWLETFIGTCELLGATGLILPWLTGVQRWLTPLAAAGLMVLILPSHAYRGNGWRSRSMRCSWP